MAVEGNVVDEILKIRIVVVFETEINVYVRLMRRGELGV